MTRAYLGGNVWAKWDGEKLNLSTQCREGLARWIELDASQVAELKKHLAMLDRYVPQIQEASATL